MGLDLTVRTFWLMVHLGLGVIFLHCFAAGLAGLYLGKLRRLNIWIMVTTAWTCVITGTWIVYPWYRAKPPEGADLTGFPRSWLLSQPGLVEWHNFAMEWKEHVGWLAPFLATAVALVVIRYGPRLQEDIKMRRALTVFFFIAFGAALVAATAGAFLNKVAASGFLLLQ